MKRLAFISLLFLGFTMLFYFVNSCKSHTTTNSIEGTWKMIYAETKENDSIEYKDLSNTNFIKILNDSHFAFFNQEHSGNENFYGGAGIYQLTGNDYTETLNYTSVEAIKNHKFSFKVEIKGDTLIQSGLEEVKSIGMKREIIEKYVRIDAPLSNN